MQRLQELKSELPLAGSGCRFIAKSRGRLSGLPSTGAARPSSLASVAARPSPLAVAPARSLVDAVRGPAPSPLWGSGSLSHGGMTRLDSVSLLGELACQTLTSVERLRRTRSHPRAKTPRPASVSPENYQVWVYFGFSQSRAYDVELSGRYCRLRRSVPWLFKGTEAESSRSICYVHLRVQ